jgi:hypothetical protein
MQNGGIIRLRDPLRLIYSIGLQQKSNSEPLNPEPVNGYKQRHCRCDQLITQSPYKVVIWRIQSI